jgi:hypothetical protein
MRRVLTSIVVLLSAAACQAAEPLAPRLGPTPVVVELFTSQGCSSCPPADQIVSDLAHDDALRGRVIPLTFHVDYWDRLGWRDPFSSAEWSRRQYTYVQALRANAAYTPQVVVGGARQFVGSNRAALEETLVALSHRKTMGSVSLTTTRSGAKATIHVNAKGSGNLLLAVFDNSAATSVRAGENLGRTIPNDATVRRLVRVGTLTGGVLDRQITLDVDPSWHEPGVAAFLQDEQTLAIGAAASARF